MAPRGTRSAPKRKATTTAAEPAAKKAKTTAAPNTSKKVTARSAILAAGKANPVAKKSSTAAVKKAAPKSTTVASKKAPTKAPATASNKATPKATATASTKATPKSTATASKKARTTSTATATKKAPTKATASAAKKAAAPAKATATTTKKRKRDDEEDDDDKDDEEKEEEVKKAARPAKKVKAKVVINDVPVQKLDVYVFGEGSSGELGLGIAKTAIDVKRPRLNPLLSAKDVGVVQIATGGMHVLALTKDSHILTWGVNDHGALGRDTAWDGGMEDIADNKSNSDSDDASDSGLNPRESTPTAIPSDCFPAGTVFVKVAAGDSLSLALTDDGHVYGWGTFRVSQFLSFLEESTNIAPGQRRHRGLFQNIPYSEHSSPHPRPNQRHWHRLRRKPRARARHQRQRLYLGLRRAKPTRLSCCPSYPRRRSRPSPPTLA